MMRGTNVSLHSLSTEMLPEALALELLRKLDHRAILIGALGAVVACRGRPAETRIVVVTAAPVATLAAPVVLAEPTRAPMMESAEFSFPVTEPTPSPSSPSAITEFGAPAAIRTRDL
jgi:hypothetical protein